MSDKGSKFFNVMVIGENPQDLMSKFSIDIQVEPYVKYHYADAEQYRQKAIENLEGLLKQKNAVKLPPSLADIIQSRLSAIKNQSAFEYYQALTYGLYYNEEGDALSCENPKGYWKTAHIARNFANPLILKDGSQSYSALAKDIDFDAMNSSNKAIYERTWDLIMGGIPPKDKVDEQIIANMQNKENYLSSFHTKEKYVLYNTTYWSYAVVTSDGEWHDADTKYKGNMTEWINNFRMNFIHNLLDEDKISIYECTISD